MPAGDEVMSVVGLKKSYGGRLVLDVDRLDVRRGEVLAVLGPSGAGKTTLLRLLATLEEPSAGEVRFGDLVWAGRLSPADLLDWRRRLSFVPQNPVLFTGTVRFNVEMALALRGRDGPAASDEVEALLDRVGLLPLAGARAGSLSTGEAQRVCLARALVTRPDVLLFDEPTASLDPANVAIIEEALREAVRGWRPAVVIVTHNLFQARRVADRAALLVAGKLVEVGETDRLLDRPSDPRTAAFVRGEMVY